MEENKLLELLNLDGNADIIAGMFPNDVFVLDVSKKGYAELFVELGEIEFTKQLKDTMYKILADSRPHIKDIEEAYPDLKIRYSTEEEIKLHELSSKHLNHLVKFECIIMGIGERKLYVKKINATCSNCFNTYNYELTPSEQPLKYLYCLKCEKKIPVEQNNVSMGSVQTLIIQEPIEHASNFAPVSFTAKVYDDLVGELYHGQRVKATGIERFVYNNKKSEHEIYIQLTNVVPMESEKIHTPSREELNKYLNDLKNPEDFKNKLISSFAPDIYSDEIFKNIKLSVLLQLVNGVKNKKQGNIHICIIGDPALGKSEFIKTIKRIKKKSMFATGRGASGVGLTVSIEQLSDKTRVATMGVIPLCSGGIALIDEFDKMNDDNRSYLHEAMAQGRITVAKSPIRATFPADTRILALANPKFGKYDVTESISENIDLPPSLISRFDLIWCMVDTINSENDRNKGLHIMKSFVNNFEYKTYMTEEELSRYLNYAENLEPKIPENLIEKYVDIYVNTRELAKISNSKFFVGARFLDTIFKLSTAHAKLLLKEVVDEYDIKSAIDLLNYAYGTLGFSLSNNVSSEIAFKKMSKAERLFHIFNTKSNNGVIREADLIKEMVNEGVCTTEEEAEKMIYLYMKKPLHVTEYGGYLKKITSTLFGT